MLLTSATAGVLQTSDCPHAGAHRQDRARHSQRMVVELLMADTVVESQRPDSELLMWAQRLGVDTPRFPMRAQPAPDFSHLGIEVRLDACIQCTRCVRASREVQVNDVIGYAHRGNAGKIVFDFDDPMANRSASAAANAYGRVRQRRWWRRCHCGFAARGTLRALADRPLVVTSDHTWRVCMVVRGDHSGEASAATEKHHCAPSG